MAMNASLRERFAQLGPTQAIDREPSGSPVAFILRPASGLASIQAVTATLALARRGLSMLRAKRAIEAMLDQGQLRLICLVVEDAAAVVRDLAASGIAASLASKTP